MLSLPKIVLCDYRLESGDLITLSFIVKFINFRSLRETALPQEGIIAGYFLNVCSMNGEMIQKKKSSPSSFWVNRPFKRPT